MNIGDKFLWESSMWKRLVVELIAIDPGSYPSYRVKCIEAVRHPYAGWMHWREGEIKGMSKKTLETWTPITKSTNFNSLYEKLSSRG